MNLKKINDSSFNRLLNILNNQTFAVISAYRATDADGNKITKKQNIQRNRELRGKFNDAKMGVYQLVGHWQEAPDGMSYEEAKAAHKLTDVTERSYVVPKPSKMSDDAFISFIEDCMTIDGLTQDACIIHTDKFYLLFNDGTTEELGEKVSMNKIGQAFSQSVLKLDTPFIFDSVAHPTCVTGYLAFSKLGILYIK